ncbi:hypothetical protein XENTR_v10013543 [Xenopus tropicalis]|nr:hypothetical protein XENTR_v10013543 [Xenopus tropicalis]
MQLDLFVTVMCHGGKKIRELGCCLHPRKNKARVTEVVSAFSYLLTSTILLDQYFQHISKHKTYKLLHSFCFAKIIGIAAALGEKKQNKI